MAVFCAGPVGPVAANRTGGVASCGIAGGSDKAALPLAVPAAATPYSAGAVAGAGSTGPAPTITDVARLTSIGGRAFWGPGEPRRARSAPIQPARAAVPQNAARTAN